MSGMDVARLSQILAENGAMTGDAVVPQFYELGDGGAAAVEVERFYGTRARVLEALSTGRKGRAASLFWRHERPAAALVGFARSGRVIAQLERSGPVEDLRGVVPRAVAALLKEARAPGDFDQGAVSRLLTGATAALEAFTGVSLATARCMACDQLPPHPADGAEIGRTVLDYEYPVLASRIRLLDPGRARELATTLTHALMIESGLSEIPELARVAEAVRPGGGSRRLLLEPGEAYRLEGIRAAFAAWTLKESGGDPDAVGAMEGEFLNQRSWAARAVLALENPDDMRTALECTDATLTGFRSSRTSRGFVYIEDHTGRRRDSSKVHDWGREPLVKRLIERMLDTNSQDWPQLEATLPPPFTPEQRAAIITDDYRRQARGEFGEYDIVDA
ncbi:hypothetical protein ACFQ3F_22820 [Nocardioides ginsengisoli]|uniref:Uncharacterized protein n=1 Tax=Nocardioides ginsengisoli TaxID=363868 RepID=A0ABW3W717_9ACTN